MTSKFNPITLAKVAGNKIVDAAKAVDHTIIDPVQSKVTETWTEHQYVKAAKGVMREQILSVGKSVVEAENAAKAQAKAEELAAKEAAKAAEAGAMFTDAYTEGLASITAEQVDATIAQIVEVCNN